MNKKELKRRDVTNENGLTIRGTCKRANHRRPRRVEVGPESLKLTKLVETVDIKAFLMTFERAAEAHRVEQDKRAAILAPQLTGKARLAYAAMSDEDA